MDTIKDITIGRYYDVLDTGLQPIATVFTSARIADALDAPPFPVVPYVVGVAFATGDGLATAVTIPGIGRVYAKHFRNWVGRPLPEVVDTAVLQELEPSPELLVAMLEVSNG